MTKSNLRKKAQGLPLNTIVIAILVIIVMLVIVVFFTSQIGESGSTIDDTQGQFTGSNACSVSNPAATALGYTQFSEANYGQAQIDAGTARDTACNNALADSKYIPIPVEEGKICCGKK